MIKARNTTTGAETEENTFEEAMAWGIFHLPGPTGEISRNFAGYKEEFLRDGRTCFVDCQGRCYAETIEIWDTEKWDCDSEGWEEW